MEILIRIEALDERREKGGERWKQNEGIDILESKNQKPEPPSRNRTAELLGIGQSKVSAARVVLDAKENPIQFAMNTIDDNCVPLPLTNQILRT